MTETAIAIGRIVLACAIASTFHEATHYLAAVIAGRGPRWLLHEWAVEWETVGASGAVVRRADWLIALAPALVGVPVGVGLWWVFGAAWSWLLALVGLAGMAGLMVALDAPAWLAEFGFGPALLVAAGLTALFSTLPLWAALAYTFYAYYGLVTNDVRFETSAESWALDADEAAEVGERV